ncbi:Cytochrome P450 [Rhizoctonia solani]|uniref:Cytochrome P450 n=1 Tax=Rhizoctonia solani TaxID=456999 RepID=A0A8H7H6W2_9AGAM|nr:Cytochrome P450 [Rhizoctonia solani]
MIQEPSLYAYAELDWGGFGSLVGYGDRWRKYRRLMNPWLTKQAVASHHGHQERATRKLLQRLLERRQKYMCSHELECELFLSISATLLHSIYGYEAMTSDDHYLVETQAILSFLAGAALSSIRQSNNEGAPVMVASLRADALEIGLTEDEADDYVSQIAITMFSGGTDTTVNTLIMFFMAMVLYPDVQKRAQAEIDSMLGHSRLPKVEDRPRLKYVDRVVQETLRWGPVTPIAVPHTCFKDDIYKSYRIPKGAIVMGNVWAMTCDKNVYKDPEVFEPDRYLDPATPFSPVFGWGRRRCPGIHLGQSSLFITIASILMTFDIGTIIDSDGKEVLPGGKMINAIVLTPERFEFELTPRSAKHEELIRGGL